MARILSEEQKRKYYIFTNELENLLTVLRDEHTRVRYYVKDNGTEIVEVFDKLGNEIAKTDATGISLIAAVHNIIVMLIHG